jgi:uncharacterized protein (TIGR03437 family)
LEFRFSFILSTAVLSLASFCHAAPALRLTNTTVGPVSIAAGGTVAAPLLEAYNAGDGTLTLGAPQISVPWATATVGASGPCKTTTLASICFPIQIQLNVSGLAASSTPYSGTVTITAPNAVDAPQTIAVLAQVGGAVPSSVSVYVAPGSTQDVAFTTNSLMNGQTKTNDGNSWLSLALQGTGSFRFVFPYYIQVVPQSSQTSGTYTGTITTSGSNFAGDNKTINVTMNVTTQPIAQPSSSQVNLTLAQGAAPETLGLALSNAGQGTLTVQGVSSTGQGVTATAISGGAALTFNPGTLAPGNYSGTVTVASNAANGPVVVPVNFTVEANGPPSIPFQGVVDDAIFAAGDAVAPGDIVALFGDQLSFSAPASGQAPPLATQIGTTQVLIDGQAAPLFYASYGQINLQVPVNTAVGTATVQVMRDGLTSNTISLAMASRAPRILLIGGGPYGIIVNATDGSYPAPVGTFPGSHPATAGDTLVVYCIGMGPTSPAVATGAPAPSASPLAQLTVTPQVNFGGSIAPVLVTPLFAGLTPTYAGLYQINVTIPPGTSKGVTALSIVFPDSTSNTVQLAIQ